MCLSGIATDGTDPPARVRPPLRGPLRGMSLRPVQCENPAVAHIVDSPAPKSPGTGKPVRLLLVDDHQVVLEGLVSMLAAEQHRVTVIGATTEPGEALKLAADLEPDVVLLDVRLKGASGLD